MQANFHSIVAETLISRLDSIHSKSKGLKNEEDRSIDHRAALRHFDPSSSAPACPPENKNKNPTKEKHFAPGYRSRTKREKER